MNLSGLNTEKRNKVSGDLDRMSAVQIATLMNQQDAAVLRAIKKVLPQIGKAIDVISGRLQKGGRLIYVGSGTSGRIGALDSSECPPTFGTDPKMVQYVMAGGDYALSHASEASEDSREAGIKDMRERKPGKKDVVVGLAASGRTPYTIAALEYARSKGAAAISVTCNAGSELSKVADVAIEAVVGAEVLTGSTRLKAGSAQKMVCNMLTTGAMSRMGYVYGNLMVNVHLKNEKLVERGIGIVQEVADVDRKTAETTLKAAEMKVQVAAVMLRAGVSKTEAVRRLKRNNGHIRKSIKG